MNHLKSLLGLEGGAARAGNALGGFVDSLLQGFENRRAGLGDDAAHAGGQAALDFFAGVYAEEAPRLREAVALPAASLPEGAQEALGGQVDELIRNVVLPAYARLAAPFTRAERNDFYLVAPAWHALERAGWAVAGMLLGAFVIWAPFIPLWEKEWILPFALTGLFFPNIRRVVALRRYQRELNRLVARTDDEIWRLELGFLTSGAPAMVPVSRPAEERPMLKEGER